MNLKKKSNHKQIIYFKIELFSQVDIYVIPYFEYEYTFNYSC